MIIKPKVSVSIITYNHEKYIAQAVESVLGQKTNFPFEIIIGEDGSKDKTAEICQAIQRKYPDKIKLFLNDRSHVIYVDGAPTGKWNLNNNIEAATGEYVALLEGDDFWTDDTKLQQQVDYLEQNPDCSLCFHDIVLVNADGQPKNIEKLPDAMKHKLDRTELISGYYPTPPTASILYRRKHLSSFPNWFYKFKNGDIAISIILSEFGKAGYIDKKMSAYRVHGGGIWSSKGKMVKAKSTIKMRSILVEMFQPIGVKHNLEVILDNHLLVIGESLRSIQINSFFRQLGALFLFLLNHPARIGYFIKRITRLTKAH